MSAPSIYVTIRGDRALVRGPEAGRAVQMTQDEPTWSRGGRGWVISSASVPDLVAYAQVAHLLLVVSDITGKSEVAS
jgi:hypothetical protein